MNEMFETARSLQSAGRLEEAEAAYRTLLDQSPDFLKGWNNLGVILESTGRAEEAVDAYEQAIRVDASQAMLHYNRGHALHLAGRHDEAIKAYRHALELNEGDGDTHANLAMALHQTNRAEEAVPHYQRALVLLGIDATLAARLGECLYVAGHVKPAREAYARATSADPNHADAFAGLARCDEVLREFGSALRWYQRATRLDPQETAAHEGAIRCAYRLNRRDELDRAFAEWERVQPGHPVAAHMRAAMLGGPVPERASADYVANVFDGFSITFDETLQRLRYRAPSLIAHALRTRGTDRSFDILDLGCGTGLCGPLLKPLARRLVGIDLSSGMLTKAKERGDYDELILADIPPFLMLHPAAYNAIVAADTLCYFGDLQEVIAGSFRAMQTNGLYIFTVERAEDGEADESGFVLRPHGRYAHSESYVRRTLVDAGFRVESVEDEILRHEGGVPQHGWLVTASRPA